MSCACVCERGGGVWQAEGGGNDFFLLLLITPARTLLRVHRFDAVFLLLMPYEHTFVNEAGIAQVTLQDPHVPVRIPVGLQAVRPGKALTADFTLVRPFAGVRAKVDFERFWPCKFLLAQVTSVA